MPYKSLEAQRAAQRRYYDRNKAKVLTVARDRRSKVVRYVQEYKQERGCMDCKVMYPYWILQLDRRPGEGKVSNVAALIKTVSFEEVKAEITKCDVVCANCHADRTHDRITTSGASIIPDLILDSPSTEW